MKRSALLYIFIYALSCHFACYANPANTNTLRVQNSQYISSGATFYRDGASPNNSSLSVWIDQEKKLAGGTFGRADIKDEYSATENWNYLNIYQLYIRRKVEGVKFALGRKLESWSAADDDWKQGIFQSRYMQNKLWPEPAGLVGVFAAGGDEQVSWMVAGLPFNVPDFAAHFSIEKSQFVSKNPWFDPPVSNFRFRGQDGNIRYRVAEPPINEVIFHPGLIAKTELQDKSGGVRLTGAYKPVSQLLLGFPSLNRVIVGANEDYLQVDITPKIKYHWVASIDGWVKAGGWSLGGSVIHDHVLGQGFDDSFTSQRFSPAWIFAATASRPLEEEGPYAARIRFGVLKIEGGARRDSGVFATDRSLFEKRFQYDEAYTAGLFVPVRGVLAKALDSEARVTYDRIQGGGVLSLNLGYSPAPGWRLEGEMDILGLISAQGGETTGFFSNYRANDRIGVGTSYVF